MKTARGPVRTAAVAVVVSVLAALAPVTATAVLPGAPPQPHIEPPPRHTAVRPGQDHGRLEISGTKDPGASVVDAVIVIEDENGVVDRRSATDRIIDAGSLMTGNYTLGTLPPGQQSATHLYLLVTTKAGSGPAETGKSNEIPIDIIRPEVDYVVDPAAPGGKRKIGWRLIDRDTIEVEFTEPVDGPNQPSDWAIGPSDDDVCPFESDRPAAVSGSGAVRTLTLARPVSEDATPHVCYNSDVEAYHDGAFNLVAGEADFALDKIPPRPPVFTHIDGKTLDSNDTARSNDPTPDITVGTVTEGHRVRVYLDNDNGTFEPADDREVGTAVAGSGGQALVTNVGASLPGGRLPEGVSRFFVRAFDPSGNASSTASADTARYDLDTIVPQAVAAAATNARVFVSFSEPIFGPNDASRWCVSTGSPVTEVKGANGSAVREIVVAGLSEGDTISYDQCGGSPDPATRYADAVGNKVAPFTLTVTGGPVVLIEDAEPVLEGQGSTFTVTITAPPAEAVSVAYKTIPGSATAEADYTSTTSFIVFPQGEAGSQTVSIPTLGDGLDEHAETFDVEIDTNSEHARVLAGADRATGTITDDDPPAAASITNASVDEGGKRNLTVSLNAASGKDVTVGWRTVDRTAEGGRDFEADEGTVSIPAGETSATVRVTTLQDALDEEDETFDVELVNPVNATIADGRGRVTITDDDLPPTLRISDADAVERDTASETAEVVVTLSTPSGRAVSFDWLDVPETATRGQDYRATPRRVTIPAGSVSATLPIEVLPDTLDESDETLRVELAAVEGAEPPGHAGTVTILDNDGPTDTDRNGGDDRSDTSVETSRDTFPGTTDNVVLARSDAYPDALAGGPLAVELLAPILLTPSDELHEGVRREIQRLDARTAYLLGGPAALAPELESELRSLGLDVVRIGGENRFETAQLIAEELGTSDLAYVAEGINLDPNRGWPDAVAVSALAAHQRAPILLTRAGDLPPETADALTSIGAGSVTVVGGTVAVSEAVEGELRQLATVERLAGLTRYGTSRAIADRSVAVGMEPRAVWFATGRNWPDSLSAGPAVVIQGDGVLVLIDGLNGFNTAPEIGDFLDAHVENILRLVLIGGESAITPEVAEAIRLRVDG